MFRSILFLSILAQHVLCNEKQPFVEVDSQKTRNLANRILFHAKPVSDKWKALCLVKATHSNMNADDNDAGDIDLNKYGEITLQAIMADSGVAKNAFYNNLEENSENLAKDVILKQQPVSSNNTALCVVKVISGYMDIDVDENGAVHMSKNGEMMMSAVLGDSGESPTDFYLELYYENKQLNCRPKSDTLALYELKKKKFAVGMERTESFEAKFVRKVDVAEFRPYRLAYLNGAQA